MQKLMIQSRYPCHYDVRSGMGGIQPAWIDLIDAPGLFLRSLDMSLKRHKLSPVSSGPTKKVCINSHALRPTTVPSL